MEIPQIGTIAPLSALERRDGAPRAQSQAFSGALAEAIRAVDELQKHSEAAQGALAGGRDVEVHDVLIRVEQADVAFRTMMEIRNKLVQAYQEIMRL
jgi:flagellar hook-basal body complex protein FliE